MRITILYNEPSLATDHPEYAQEAGVLESVQAIGTALSAAGHQVSRLGARSSATELVNQLALQRPDVVVNLCEGFAGRPAGEPHVAGLLELLRLPYTGCGAECTALARDKARTKWLLQGAGLPTARFVRLTSNDPLPRPLLEEWLASGMLFVKPAAEDASLGIGMDSVVADWPAFVRQVDLIRQRYGDALVERYIDGREFNVGIVALPEPQLLPLAEIEFRTGPQLKWPVLTYEGKWREGSAECELTPVRCPANVEPELAKRIGAIALEAFRVVGCRDYARVDLRVTSSGDVFILEVNANPDAGPSAGFARALRIAGIDYDQFARRLVETASARGPHPTSLPTPAAPVKACHPDPASSPPSSAFRLPPSAFPVVRPFAPSDRQALLDMLQACNMFRPDEIEVAGEILDEAAEAGPEGHYKVLVAESEGRLVGWSCHGLIPMTDASYDLYWIAVHPDCQSQGIGRLLLAAIEERLRASGGRWLIAETSSSEIYAKTRAFYLRTGFDLASDLPDFYRANDGKHTFAKRLSPVAT